MTGTTPAAWNDPVKGAELAKAQKAQGADVIYAAAGGTGIGVLQAAADEGILSIGVDSNQNYLHPGQVLTSMLKRVDNAVYDAFKEGEDLTPGINVMDLKAGRRGLCAGRQQRGADHPGNAGRRRTPPPARSSRASWSCMTTCPTTPARRRRSDGMTAANHRGAAGNCRPTCPRHRAEGHLQGLRSGAGEQGHLDPGAARHDPRHHRRERRRQIDADVDPLRLLQGRFGRDPHQRQPDRHPRQPERHPRRHRHGLPAFQAGAEFHRAGKRHPGRRGRAAAEHLAGQGAQGAGRAGAANTSWTSIPTR